MIHHNIMKYLSYLFLFVLIISTACNKSIEQLASDADKLIYDVVFRENLAGSYEKWSTGPQSYEYHYAYSDRGRGPENTEKVNLNSEGFIATQSITGVNYRKVPVDEHFRSEGSQASWKNTMEEKSASFDGTKLYFRHSGSPAIYEILSQRLLSADDGKVDLFPEGQAELIKKVKFEVSDGNTIDLLMIKGLGMNPSYVWMNGNEMVARIAGNLHIIQKESSALRHELKSLQDNIEDEYLIEVANKVSHLVEKVIIKNVNVFTKDGTILPAQDVWVDDEQIIKVNPTSGEDIPADAKVLDGSGKTLLPGMFDMHTHNTKFRGLLHLAGGVTSVRDLANDKQLRDLANQFNNNEILGPRIVIFCGIIDGPGKYANQRNAINNLEEGLAEVEDYKSLGYDQIKLYSSIKPEWVQTLTDRTHELGMRVSGHIPAYMTATQAIHQGYNEIQHINMLFLTFLSDTIDTRTPLRFTMPGQHGADLNLNSEEYIEFVELLKSKDILIDPTIAIFENMYMAKKGEASPTYSHIVNRLPLMNQRSYYSGGYAKDEVTANRYMSSFGKMMEVVNDLFHKGVNIVPGTDGLPGFLYHRELELYEQSGIPAAEVLKLATIKSALITGVEDRYGSIEIGKQADLILIDGSPTEDIRDIRKVEWTMKGPHLYYAEELYATMGIKHYNNK